MSNADKLAIQPLLGEALARRAGQEFDVADRKADETMRAAGVVMTNASPEFITTVKQKTALIEGQWAEKAKTKGVDGTQILQTFRKELIAQAAQSKAK